MVIKNLIPKSIIIKNEYILSSFFLDNLYINYQEISTFHILVHVPTPFVDIFGCLSRYKLIHLIEKII